MLEEISQAQIAPQHGGEESADQEEERHSKPVDDIKRIPINLRALVYILRDRQGNGHEGHQAVNDNA